MGDCDCKTTEQLRDEYEAEQRPEPDISESAAAATKYVPPHRRESASNRPSNRRQTVAAPSGAEAENESRPAPAAREAHWPHFVAPTGQMESECSKGSFGNVPAEQMSSSDWAALCDEHDFGGWGEGLPEFLPMRCWDDGWVQIPRCAPWHNPIVRQVLLGTHDHSSALSRLRASVGIRMVERVLRGVLDFPAAIWPRRGLDSRILEALAAHLTRHCTAVQMISIPFSCSGRDLFCSCSTGSGKTLVRCPRYIAGPTVVQAYLIPILSCILQQPPLDTEMVENREDDQSVGCLQEHPDVQRWTDKVAALPTAGAASACPLGLVLLPTRELTCSVQCDCERFCSQIRQPGRSSQCLAVKAVFGGAPLSDQMRRLRQGCQLLLATPGRLADMVDHGFVSLARVKCLCLDEADRMLDMGFEPQIRRIVQQSEMPSQARQTLVFCAQVVPGLKQLVPELQVLRDQVFLRVGGPRQLLNGKIEHQVHKVPNSDAKDRLLVELLQSLHPAATLLFVSTKRRADYLESFLTHEGFAAAAVHGDKSQSERNATFCRFKSGETSYLVVTDVASRGLDALPLAHVVNYDLPGSPEDYAFRTAKVGRRELGGLATSFVSNEDARTAQILQARFCKLLNEHDQDIPGWIGDFTA